MMESSMNATSAVFLVNNVSNNMASIMSVMDDSGNLTSLAANINKSSNNQELHQRMCPTGFHENTEDLMCMKKINFDEQYKNPCWNPKVDDLACLPYFMIIGMQKCGTTDLFRAMIKHVNIIPPRDRYGDMVKETHFFDAFHYGHKLDDFEPRQYLSFKDYRNMFSSLSTKIKKGNTNFITGEATPAYLWRLYTWKLYPQNKNKTKPIVLLPDLVRHIIPNVKLIIVLRDPVDRSRSSYFYSHSPKKPVEAFDKAFLGGLRLIKDCFKVKTEVECILNDTLIMPFRKQVDHILPGLYYYFIKEWFRAFPREQFMIINFKDYKNNKTKTLNRIFKFLELSTLTEEEMINSGMITKQAKNRGRQIRLSSLNSSTVSKLQEFFRPYNKLLLNLLNSSSFDWT
ncbi:carbohydrate sulfotransferase 15-like [Mytilus galloprovincialis]|uniref:carbohydrate sulfotransferase 15-like n=1 Tax=Mytilus galloprovincialis TaxID=29158 RepID=UPI003F7CA896